MQGIQTNTQPLGSRRNGWRVDRLKEISPFPQEFGEFPGTSYIANNQALNGRFGFDNSIAQSTSAGLLLKKRNNPFQGFYSRLKQPLPGLPVYPA
jgi:hypothetical protein